MDNYIEIEQTNRDIELKNIFEYINTTEVELSQNYQIKTDKDYTIEFTISSDSKSIVILNDIPYEFSPNSREITFINMNNSTIQKVFVYKEEIIEEYMENNNLKTYSLENSVNSETNITGFLDSKETIIVFGKGSKILTKDRFDQYVTKIKDIKSLSFLSSNAMFYYPNNYEDIFHLFNEYDSLRKKLLTLIKNNHVIQVFGPKSCFKTTFLLFMRFCLNRDKKGVFYINYEYLSKNQSMKKTILYNELLYSALSREDVKKIYDLRLLDVMEYENSMEDIKKVIESYMEKIEKVVNLRKVIILDNVKNLNYAENKILEDIIFKFKCTNKKITLIICGDGEFFNKNIRLNLSGTEDKIKLFNLHFNNNLKEQKTNYLGNKFSYFKNPSFFIEENDLSKYEKDKIEFIQEENHYCQNYKFQYLFYMYEYNEYCFSLKDFGDFHSFDLLPNYYNIQIDNVNNKVTLKFNNLIFKKVIMAQISFGVQKLLYQELLFNTKFPRLAFGIGLEYLIILLFMYNRFDYGNLKIAKENIIEIEKISKIKDINFIKQLKKPKLIKDKSILIHQENFRGEFYDLLIIHTSIRENTAIFIQIGTDKTELQISKIKVEFETYKESYQINLKEFLGITIHKIGLLFIFDKDTQLNQKAQGRDICYKKNIKYYLFDIHDCKLYNEVDWKIYPLLHFEMDNQLLFNDSEQVKPQNIIDSEERPFKPNYRLNHDEINILEKKISEIKGYNIYIDFSNAEEFRDSTTFEYFSWKVKKFPKTAECLHVLKDCKTNKAAFYFNDIFISGFNEFKANDTIDWDLYRVREYH